VAPWFGGFHCSLRHALVLDAPTMTERLQGVLYGRSWRSTYCSWQVCVTSGEYVEPTDASSVLVRLQLHADEGNAALGASLLRHFKQGDLIQVSNGRWEETASETKWKRPRFVVDMDNLDDVQVVQAQVWTKPQWQTWQKEFCVKCQKKKNKKNNDNQQQQATKLSLDSHTSSMPRFEQAQILVDFLMTHKIIHRNNSRVWDVAGGSGFLSYALALRGIHSTVVDPRPHVGCLPKRFRKQYRASLAMSSSSNIAIPFEVQRAWFGDPPDGVETDFRTPDDIDIPVIHQQPNCTTLVALHPDEATDAVVCTAVRYRIPFLIVPCCVFARHFVQRRYGGKPVTTYEQLLDYLQTMDASIQRSELPFDGKHIALWSTFDT